MSRYETLRPDSKGRVTLGLLAKGVSSFHVTINKDHSLLLIPFAEIPAAERWIFENAKAQTKLKQGLEDSANSKLVDLGDFTKYLNDDSSKSK